MNRWLFRITTVLSSFVCLAQQPLPTSSAQSGQAGTSQGTGVPRHSANSQMQRLFSAQVGHWVQKEERADGSTGEGEAVWRPGPGGMSLVEDEYIRSSGTEVVGLSVTWWDEGVQGYRALWCSNHTKNGCLVMSKPAHWEGDQFVLADRFEGGGKQLDYREVESEITPNTYTLTSYIGESGGELKKTSTIHATRIAEDTSQIPSQMRVIVDALAGTWNLAWIDKTGKVVGIGTEIWKLAPGGSALVEENRSVVDGKPDNDYATMWWDGKARKVRGIWCSAEINDEGCSGFEASVMGNDVILNGEWEHNSKRKALA